jgi:hypothetical protein
MELVGQVIKGQGASSRLLAIHQVPVPSPVLAGASPASTKATADHDRRFIYCHTARS